LGDGLGGTESYCVLGLARSRSGAAHYPSSCDNDGTEWEEGSTNLADCDAPEVGTRPKVRSVLRLTDAGPPGLMVIPA